MISTQDELEQQRDQLTRLIFVGQRLLTIVGFVFGLRRARKSGLARPAAPIAAALLLGVDLWAAYRLEAAEPAPSQAAGLSGSLDESGDGTAVPAPRPTVAGVAKRLVTS